MKILSWNIERPKINDERKNEIIGIINSLDADLIFLTETNSDINFKNYFSLKTTEQSPKYKGFSFEMGENKATIFSKYEIKEEIETYDDFSSVCGKIETEFGEITLYCSIIGFLGGKDGNFKFDLKNQKEDLRKVSLNSNVCFSGDLNVSFSGYPYPSKEVISELKTFFELNDLVITTESCNDCAIHIVLSRSILVNREVKTQMTDVNRMLSDHNIVITEIA